MSAITVRELRAQLERGLDAAGADALAERIRARIGVEALARDSAQFVDELEVTWAIAAPGAQTPPMVVAELGADWRLPTQPLGDTGIFVATTRLEHGAAVRWYYEVNGTRTGGGQTEAYRSHPDSHGRPDVPKGRLVAMPPWRSQIFAGTVRD